MNIIESFLGMIGWKSSQEIKDETKQICGHGPSDEDYAGVCVSHGIIGHDCSGAIINPGKKYTIIEYLDGFVTVNASGPVMLPTAPDTIILQDLILDSASEAPVVLQVQDTELRIPAIYAKKGFRFLVPFIVKDHGDKPKDVKVYHESEGKPWFVTIHYIKGTEIGKKIIMPGEEK